MEWLEPTLWGPDKFLLVAPTFSRSDDPLVLGSRLDAEDDAPVNLGARTISVHAERKDLASEMRRLVLARVKIQVSANESVGRIFCDDPISALPLARRAWNTVNVVLALNEVDCRHQVAPVGSNA